MAIPSLLGVSKKDVSSEIDLSTVEGVLMHYMNYIVEQTKENLANRGSNASYQLSQSIRPEFEVKTTRFGLNYIMKIYMEKHYEYVDLGRPKGKQPPFDAIVSWIRNKEGFKIRGLAKIGDIRERGKNKRKKYTREEIIKQNAWGIAKKIAKQGTKGNSFLSDVVNDEFYNNINRDLSKALKRDVEVTVKNIIDTKEYLADGTKRFK